MTFTDLRFEHGDGLAMITLNRPPRLNALLRRGLGEFNQALDMVEGDEDLKVLIITGAPRPDGRPCFCTGLDLDEIADKGVPPMTRPGPLAAVEGMAVLGQVENSFMGLCDRLESFPRPTIAAIDGVCTAGGLELALCCDLLLASETAQISDLHLKNLGVLGGGGATVRLARRVGPAKAKEIAFMGEVIDGNEAWRIGLANKVVPAGELMERTKEWGSKMVKINPSGLRLAKVSINASLDMSTRQALRYSYICMAALGDVQERARQLLSTQAKSK